MGEQENALHCQRMALQQQLELIEDAQRRMAAWAQRRQVALESGIQALQKMSACTDPVSMASICGEWVSGSLSRIMADMDDARDHALKMAEHVNKASQALFTATAPAAETAAQAAEQQQQARLPARTAAATAPPEMRVAAE